MKIEICEILENSKIASGIYRMKLKCDTSWIQNPGQFVDIKVSEKKLRRPISVSSWDENSLTLVYRVVGKGTEKLTELKANEKIEMLSGCGNGFDLDELGEEILVIGGGIGCAPLMGVIEEALKKNKKVNVIFGFRNKEEAYFEERLKELNVDYDFSYDSEHENCVDKMLKKGWQNLEFVTCGPIKMMEAITLKNHSHGLVSLEARMGCGFGACMGCSVETQKGMQRICKEGPVFDKGDIIWENLM